MKYHGNPKMHKILSNFYRWRKGLRDPQARADLAFWLDGLRAHWR